MNSDTVDEDMVAVTGWALNPRMSTVRLKLVADTVVEQMRFGIADLLHGLAPIFSFFGGTTITCRNLGYRLFDVAQDGLNLQTPAEEWLRAVPRQANQKTKTNRKLEKENQLSSKSPFPAKGELLGQNG